MLATEPLSLWIVKKTKQNNNNHLHGEHFRGGMLGRISAPLPLACRSEQWPDANVFAWKFRAMNCGIQRSEAIWNLSDRKVFMRDWGNRGPQPTLSHFVVQKPPIQCTGAKKAGLGATGGRYKLINKLVRGKVISTAANIEWCQSLDGRLE